MATKPNAAKPDAAKPGAAHPDAEVPVKKKPKRKKLLIIGGIVLLVLALAGGGLAVVIKKRNAALDGADVAVVHAAPKGPPTYFPLDNMVVNLADPGGEKVAQVGITLELADAHAADQVKMYLPTIRSGILLLISQRTAEDLLMIEGKKKLAEAIVEEASRPLAADHSATESGGVAGGKPVQGVLFSSFIVQ